jgi:hypothetical protein
MGIAGELVDHDQDAVTATRARKPFNEVHRDDLPSGCRHWQGLEKTWVFGAVWFRLLTGGALRN